MKDEKNNNLFDSEEFVQFRKLNRYRCEAELCSRKNPFRKLFSYLVKKRDQYQLQVRKVERNPNILFDVKHVVKYDHLINLIPAELGTAQVPNEELLCPIYEDQQGLS